VGRRSVLRMPATLQMKDSENSSEPLCPKYVFPAASDLPREQVHLPPEWPQLGTDTYPNGKMRFVREDARVKRDNN